jgi:hypothetical protein
MDIPGGEGTVVQMLTYVPGADWRWISVLASGPQPK